MNIGESSSTVRSPAGSLPLVPATADVTQGLESASRQETSAAVRDGLVGATTAPTDMSVE